MLHYQVELNDTAGHYIDVQLLANTHANQWRTGGPGVIRQLQLTLPTWIPGSYLIREFSRNILTVAATVNGRDVEVKKSRKDTWVITLPVDLAATENLTLEAKWRVYAWDLSVRTAHVDNTHAFFNGTSVFLALGGFEELPTKITIKRGSSTHKTWRFACGLRRLGADGEPIQTFPMTGCEYLEPGESVELYADSYDELIDHPVEMGELMVHQFEACGIPHTFAVYGADGDTDLARLCSDLTPVLEAQIKLFEPETAIAPFQAYWFMLHVTDDGYGGLEHRNSTALVCSRKDLPQIGVTKTPESYDTLMGLCSHEYFHSWNVKRIKPASFTPYDLSTEGYTRLLWVFEGFTSYYDDLMLARAGYFDEATYFKALGKSLSQVLKSPGRLVQPVSESSFEAWTKYYRQDENAPNAIVSYYTKGALVAFCLDLLIRRETNGKKTLDDVMRHLWVNFGKTGIGVPEDSIAKIVLAATGVDVTRQLTAWVDTTDELPLKEYAESIGLTLLPELKDGDPQVWLGANVSYSGEGMKLKQVINQGPFHQAGLSAGDTVVAFDHHKATKEHVERRMLSLQPGSQIVVHAFRAQRLFEAVVTLQAVEPQKWILKEGDETPNRGYRPWRVA